MSEPKSPIERALGVAGSEAKLAAIVGLSQPAIHKAKKAGRASPRLAISLERHFGIPRHESCPDIFDAPSTQPDPATETTGAAA